MKKTSVQSHTKRNMYLYKYICRFLKECGALVRVALSAEALGADGLLSVWDQRLASTLNAYNLRFVASTTLSWNSSPPTESWEFSLSSMASHRILDVTFTLPLGGTVWCRQALAAGCAAGCFEALSWPWWTPDAAHELHCWEIARQWNCEQAWALVSSNPRASLLAHTHDGRLWNFGGTHKIHKRFLTESTGSTWVGKEQRDNMETVDTHLFRWTLIIGKQEVYLQS